MRMDFSEAEHPDADMVLIPNGSSHLYVHKMNLSLFSAYFDTLIKSWNDSPPKTTVGDLPAIILSEKSALVVRMLEYFYPNFDGQRDHKQSRDAKQLMEALVFIDKYEVRPMVRQTFIDALT
jgi:hypothetical protein